MDTLPERIADGLERLCAAVRSHDWTRRGRDGLTPTQARLLRLAAAAGDDGLSLTAAATRLEVSGATASEAAATLVRKGLIEKSRDAGDRRAIALRPTPQGLVLAGEQAATELVQAVRTLSPEVQAGMLRGVVEAIRALQRRGAIAPARTCLDCRFFRPNAHPDPRRPHHCAFVDAAFGDGELRVDCSDHQVMEDTS